MQRLQNCYHLSTCLDLHGEVEVDWLCGNCDGDARPTKIVVDIIEDTDVLHYIREKSYPPDKTEQQKSRIRNRARRYQLEGNNMYRSPDKSHPERRQLVGGP